MESAGEEFEKEHAGFLGIAFVCHSSQRGDQLVFRYPEVVRSTVTPDTLRAYTTRFAPSDSQRQVTGVRSRTSVGRSQTQPNLGSRRTLSGLAGKDEHVDNDPPVINRMEWAGTPYNMSSVIIAPFLSPKRMLVGKTFELAIDGTRFVGVPTLLTNPDKKNAKMNVLKYPSLSKMKSQEDFSDSAVQDELTTFNIVFALTEEEANKNDGRRYQMYKDVVFQLVNALKHEQFRCGYLSSEVQAMLSVRERWLWKQSNCKEGEKPPDHQQLTDDILNSTTLAHELREIYHGLADHGQVRLCINRWIDLDLSLGDYLNYPKFPMRPYHALLLKGSRTAILDSLPQDCSPTLITFINCLNSPLQPTKSFQEINIETNIPLSHIFRMAAHLIYWGKGKLIKSLSQHSIFIPNSRMKPHERHSLDQSFAHTFPNFRLPEVLQDFSSPLPLVNHAHKLSANKQKDFLNVVVWLLRHDLITELNTYLYLNLPRMDDTGINSFPSSKGQENGNNNVTHLRDNSPSAQAKTKNSPNGQDNKLVNDDDDDEGDIDLEENNGYMKVQIKNNTIGNLKVHDDINSSSSSNGTGETDTISQSSIYPSMPQPLKPFELAYLERLNDGGMSYKLFIRLCPLFRGHHHIEEILWRMSISRDDLQKVLDKYHDIVVPCMHEAFADTSVRPCS